MLLVSQAGALLAEDHKERHAHTPTEPRESDNRTDRENTTRSIVALTNVKGRSHPYLRYYLGLKQREKCFAYHAGAGRVDMCRVRGAGA